MTTQIIVIKETWADSLIADVGTFATFAAMIGLGVWLESAAMQWTGAIVFFLSVIAWGQAKRVRMTIAQARAKLNEWEAGE